MVNFERKYNELMPQGFTIAIDGPIASGKGTTAMALSEKLGGFFINTGGMYRSVALLCIERGIDMSDEAAVATVLPDANVEFRNGSVFLNNTNVTDRLKEPDVASGSSVIAVYRNIRDDLVSKQQAIGEEINGNNQIVIAEGRDIGTRVFPDAVMKIYLTARLEVRAKRSLDRYKEKGIEKTLDEVIEETKIRDERDFNRDIDPLPKDPLKFGYWMLDNSDQTEDQTINLILEKLKERGLIND